MAVFGEARKPLYQRAAGGAPFDVDGIFDDAYAALMMSADGEPAIGTVDPVMGVRLVQFAGVDPVQGDWVTIPRTGRTYVVTDTQPDGKGAMNLVLTRKGP